MGLIAATVWIVGLADGLFPLAVLCKVTPALLLAAATGAARPAERLVRVGLLCCASGDAALELPGESLPVAMGLFGLGHIAFTVSLSLQRRRLAPWLAVPFVAWAFALVGGVWRHLEGLHLAALLYALASVSTLWRATARAAGHAHFAALASVAGALGFAVSDTLLALHLYVAPLSWERAYVMIPYWAGLTGLAVGAWLDEEPP